MIVVKDARAEDNAVSQTITSTCRGEPEQIGWNKACKRRSRAPRHIHPARDTGLSTNPATGTPFPPEGSQPVGQPGSSRGVPGSRASQETEEAATMPTALEAFKDLYNFPETGHLLKFQKKCQTL